MSFLLGVIAQTRNVTLRDRFQKLSAMPRVTQLVTSVFTLVWKGHPLCLVHRSLDGVLNVPGDSRPEHGPCSLPRGSVRVNGLLEVAAPRQAGPSRQTGAAFLSLQQARWAFSRSLSLLLQGTV